MGLRRRRAATSEVTCEPGNAQHVGDRPEQQDAFALSDVEDRAFATHGGAVAVLADGMGGLASGRQAAGAAVKAFLEAYLAKRPDERIPDALQRGLAAASAAVGGLAPSAGAEEVGTTLVAVVVQDQSLHWLSVGDSRAYLIRQGIATQVTLDHVFAADLDARAARGEIAPEDAARDAQREALTSFLGGAPPGRVDRSLRALPLEAGDLVLICSDGLHRGLSPAELGAAATEASTAQQLCEQLASSVLAKQRPGQDNLTVVALRLARPR